MKKGKRAQNLKEGESKLEELVAFDYRVVQFSPYHFRVNERLDIWPPRKRWYDHRTHRKGEYTDLVKFVKEFLPQ